MSYNAFGCPSCSLLTCLINNNHFASIRDENPALEDVAHQYKLFLMDVAHSASISQPFSLLVFKIFFTVDLRLVPYGVVVSSISLHGSHPLTYTTVMIGHKCLNWKLLIACYLIKQAFGTFKLHFIAASNLICLQTEICYSVFHI